MASGSGLMPRFVRRLSRSRARFTSPGQFDPGQLRFSRSTDPFPLPLRPSRPDTSSKGCASHTPMPIPPSPSRTRAAKTPEPSPLLDLPEHRFHDPFACRVNRSSHLRQQLPLHPLHPRRAFRQRPAPRHFPLPVFLPLLRDESFDASLRPLLGFQMLQVLLPAVPAVSDHSLRPLPRLL